MDSFFVDGTLYTGYAEDVAARVLRHNEGTGAKYTRGRRPVELAGLRGPGPAAGRLSTGDAGAPAGSCWTPTGRGN